MLAGEDKVALAFLLSIHNNVAIGAGYFIVDIERAS